MHSSGVCHVSDILTCSPDHRGRHQVSKTPEVGGEASSTILHNILHNIGHSGYMNGTRSCAGSRERVPSAEAEPGIFGGGRDAGQLQRSLACRQRDPASLYALPGHRNAVYYTSMQPPCVSRYCQDPSATITSHHCRDDLHLYPEDYTSVRNRSTSLGSAGSSIRESRSPSHDSVASRDSTFRYSPVSSGSSPSPSPPAQDSASSSKLLGILKGGSYSCTYGGRGRNLASRSEHGTGSRPELSTIQGTVHTSPRIHVLKRELSSPGEEILALDCVSEKILPYQEEPIDLSCKPKRARLENVDDPLKSPSVDSGWGSDYLTTSPVNDINRDSPTDIVPGRSILESILSGRMCSASRSSSASPVGKPPSGIEYPYALLRPDSGSPCKDEQLTSDCPESPCSVNSLSTSVPASPVSSVNSQMSVISTPTLSCPWRQKVTLAKKNLLPVSARVSDWLMKIVSFAKLRPEFSGLPELDKVTLMQHSWTRLMLLYMAETNFQFAVTPVHEDTDDGRPPAISGIDPTEPTMDSVELVQNFIRKCQTLQVDAEEFKCLRMYTLFHPGCSGLENVDFVERICSASRQALQDYVSKTRPHDRLRYSNLLLCLHSLYGVNCGMVQMLFCQHVAKNGDLDQHIRNMMLRCDAFDDDDDSGNECDPESCLVSIKVMHPDQAVCTA